MSASNPLRRYLAWLILIAAILYGSAGALSYVGLARGVGGNLNVQVFLDRRAHLDSSGPADVVLLGDSSAAHALSERRWSALSGRPTLNLALNGSYGIEGTLNMLRQVLQRFRPQTVVIMQTPGMLTQGAAPLGALYSSFGLEEAGYGLGGVFRVYFNLTTAWQSLIGLTETLVLGRDEDAPMPGSEEIVTQRPRLTAAELGREVAANPLRIEAIQPARIDDLERIADICREAELECLYAHAPLFAGYCRRFEPFLAEATARVRSAGLEVVPGTPVCMPTADVGDASDHVAPERRLAYTEKIFDRAAALPESSFAVRTAGND